MGAGIEKRLLPEEEELAKKKEELSALRTEVAEQELSLAILQAEMAAFERKYFDAVGFLYIELDDWNAKIAELVARRLNTSDAHASAAQARVRAGESRNAIKQTRAAQTDFKPSTELKSLYRQVAKRVHPDLAVDDIDRDQRERLMANANLAFQNGQFEELRRILDEYEECPERVRGEGPGVELIRVLRHLRQVRTRLTKIKEEIEALRSSDLTKLKQRYDDYLTKGRDLFCEMAENLEQRIAEAKVRFQYESRVWQEDDARG